jgi:hypothetical protein
VELAEDNSSHAYTRPLAKAAARFFCKHLRGAECQIDDAKIKPFDQKILWCTQSGQVRAEFSDAEFVHETIARRVKELEEKRRTTPAAARSANAVKWLRERVTNGRIPSDLNPRYYAHHEAGELLSEMAMWWSQEGLFSNGNLFRSKDLADKKLPVTVGIWNGGTNILQPHWDWIEKECASGRAVLVLDVSGMGSLKPLTHAARDPEAPFGLLHKLSTDLLFLGDDLALLRTYDVLRALEMIAIWPGLDAADIQIRGAGREGLYGQLAAALDPRIKKLSVTGGMASFAEWISARHYEGKGIYSLIVRGILQHIDLPELETAQP